MRNSETNAISAALPVARLPVARFLVAWQEVVRTFPRREEIEVTEFLREAHRLVHDALLLVVVAHLHESGEREILAQRMALESVIRQQPAHVRMPGKEYAVKVVGFALEPVRTGKHANDGRHRRRLADLDLHPDAQVLFGREEMIDHVEAPFAPRPVDRGDVDDAPELAAFVVAQEGGNLHDVTGVRADRQLAVRNTMIADRTRPRAGDHLAEFVERFIHGAKPISARSCRCDGSFSAATTRRRAALRRSADSRERRCRPARCGRSRARPNRNSDNSRRRWRTSPWR